MWVRDFIMSSCLCNYAFYRTMHGCRILWDHLQTLYGTTQTDSGLYVGRRLTYEHVNLISYSKMKVNLAAQV